MTKNQQLLCEKIGLKNELAPMLISELKMIKIDDKKQIELSVLKSKIAAEIDNLFSKIISDISLENSLLKEKNLKLEKQNNSLKNIVKKVIIDANISKI